MEVKAENLRIENVLTKGQYVIPDYQREYDWDEDELNEFIEDILELRPDERYFIGHMVFEGDYNGTNFVVIDGQQRITTITILLCVIRDLFYEKGEKTLGDATNDKFIFNRDKNGELFGVLINEMPYPILQARVQKKKEDRDETKLPSKNGEHKILSAYNKFLNHFASHSIPELKELREKIFNLEVIFVAAKDSDDNNMVDAHEIFMTLNATGKDLTPLDLIKGRVFKLIPDDPILNEPRDKWREIISNTQGRKTDRKNPSRRSLKFLNNFFSYRYGKVSDKKIYKKFVQEVVKNPNADIRGFLNNLHADSILFRKIADPSVQDWTTSEQNIYLSLEAITQVFGIEVANPMLISLLNEYMQRNISQRYLEKALECIERYHFINNSIVSGRSSGLDLKYSKYARELLYSAQKNNKHLVIDKFISSLFSNLPDIHKFEASFDNKLYYHSSKTLQKKLVQYALRKLESFENPNAILIDVSIEHIAPEKPNKNLHKLKEESIVNIGNLVLLDRTLNSDVRIGNNSFEEKKSVILKESRIISTKRVFQENSTWGEKEIKNRRKGLISLLYDDVWIKN